METKSSFFRRSADAQPKERESSYTEPYDIEDDDMQQSEPRRREYKPRSENSSSGERSHRGERNEHSGQRGNRPPRGERTDFRKTENRRPNEERDAPENVIYGVHPIREAIEMGRPIEKIYFRQGSVDSEALEQIRDMVRGTNIVCQDVPPERLDKLTRRNNHQGVAAVLPSIEYADFNALVEKFSTADVPPLVVVMDSVTDVRNFGAIARSAECAGADAIIMSAKNSAPVNGEAMRSSAGALSVIPVCRVGSLRNSLKTLQLAGMQLVAATEKAEKIVFEADLTKPTVVVMGSEDKGISSDILRMCDAKVSIPLLGKIESLNVSSAAAIILFEAVRQRFMAIE